MSFDRTTKKRMMQLMGAIFSFLRPLKRLYVICSIVIVVSLFIIRYLCRIPLIFILKQNKLNKTVFGRNDGKHLKVESTSIRSNVTLSNKTKTIYTYSIPEWFYIKKETVFNDLNCPVKNCRITTDEREKERADLVWFFEGYENKKYIRNPKQIFAFYSIECPAMRTYNKFDPPGLILV